MYSEVLVTATAALPGVQVDLIGTGGSYGAINGSWVTTSL